MPVRYLGALTLALVGLLGVGLLGAGKAAEAAALRTPVSIVAPSSGETLTQQTTGTWETNVDVNTLAICDDKIVDNGDAFHLVTGRPDTHEAAKTVRYDDQPTPPCGGDAVTQVELTFPALQNGAVPQSATLAVTPAAPGATPVDITLSVQRDVSVFQYLVIPLGSGLGLAALLVLAMMGFGVPLPEGGFVHTGLRDFWLRPLYAASAWTFGDSWVTNITAVGTLIGTVIAASGSVAFLLPGIDQTRFSLLIAVAGGFAVIAPVVFGVLNYRFGRRNPEAAGVLQISPPTGKGIDVTMPVGGSVTIQGDATLDTGPSLSSGTAVDVPAGVTLTVSVPQQQAGQQQTGQAAPRILVLPGSNDIVVPPRQRVTFSLPVTVPSSAVRPAPPPPQTVDAQSFTLSEGAKLSFTGRADIVLPKDTVVNAVGEPVGEVQLPVQRTFSLPYAGEIVAQMWSMLLASCFTMIGIGAELGIAGWVLGYDLAAAPSVARALIVAIAAVASAIVVLYGVFAIRALADTRAGSVLSGRRDASFIL